MIHPPSESGSALVASSPDHEAGLRTPCSAHCSRAQTKTYPVPHFLPRAVWSRRQTGVGSRNPVGRGVHPDM